MCAASKCAERQARLSGSHDKEVKRLEIFPAEVQATGEIPRDVTKKFDRANCKEWIGPVFCPDSRIVTALEMHTNDTERQFVGIMPVCKAIHTVPDLKLGRTKVRIGY